MVRALTLAVLFATSGCRALLGIDEGVVAADGGGSGSDAKDADGEGLYRKQILVESPVKENLDGFVVPILLAADEDLAAHASDDGSDLRFLDNDRVLPAEIVAFDAATGALEAWVRVPTLREMTRIDLVYGDPLEEPPATVWTPNVAGAWHLSALGPGASFLDSSPNNHVGSPSRGTLPVGLGIAGPAANFQSFQSSDRWIDVGDPQNGSLDFAASFSVSIWVRVMASAGAFDRPFYKGGSSTMDAGYSIELGTGNWTAFVSDGAMVTPAHFGSEVTLLGSWVQLAMVVDRQANELRAYVNGELRSSALLAIGSLATSKGLTFGDQTYQFRGLLDEVRIYSTAKPVSWFAAEYGLLTQSSLRIRLLSEERI